jgi:UDPglucose 6-dehydrogenase
MKIAYINEIADLCEKVGADVQQVARGIGLDNRIGAKFLHAGPGFGGSCFPKDTTALIQIARSHQSPVQLIETTVAVNDRRKRSMAARIIAACDGDVKGKTVAVLGLTFKPNTDDMRDAPAIPLVEGLQAAGARIRAHDPAGMGQARTLLRDVVFGDSPYDAAEGADALVIVTEWDAFGVLDFERLKAVMRAPVLVDLRNVYRGGEVARHGFRYSGIGRRQETGEAG